MKERKILAAITAAAALSCSVGSVCANAADKFEGLTLEAISKSPIKPYITVSSEVISADEAKLHPTRNVTVSIEAEGVSDGYYSSAGLHIYLDPALEIEHSKSGKPVFTSGEACSLLMVSAKDDTSKKPDMNGLFMAVAGVANYGINGEMFSFNVTLPENISGGEVFPIDIEYVTSNISKDIFSAIGMQESELMNGFLFTKGIYSKEYNPNFKAADSDIEKCPALKDIDPACDGYIAIEGTAAKVWGDADGNGSLSVSDIVLVLQYSANHEKYNLDKDVLAICDVNGDNVVNVDDAYLIQQADADLITLPVKK